MDPLVQKFGKIGQNAKIPGLILKVSMSETLVVDNQHIKVKQVEFVAKDGSQHVYTYVERQPSLIVVPIDEKDGERRVLLLHEFRFPNKRRFWQFPMGGLPEGEDDVAHAKRELIDETGLNADHLERIGQFFIDPGLNTQKGIIFVASSLTDTGKTDREATEDIGEMEWKTLQEVEIMIKQGEIDDAWTLSALTYLRIFLS